MIALPPEKLGSFYLGAEYDLETAKVTDSTLNYDARDLTTHAVCVGMTGSGKTGLCIGLLEEAAIDGVPALIIDPKGDMTNLMLQFEDLSIDEFKKWINPDDAKRKGLTLDEYASQKSIQWKEGLASWGQSPNRIKKLKESVDYTIFTPGSNAGIPINILGSFAAPDSDFEENEEVYFEQIQGIVAALLGMIESKEDPIKSREAILLTSIFEHYWKQRKDLNLTQLILAIQDPPITKLGVFDLETFYPAKQRFELAMEFNALVASPQFKYWLQGEPLDIQSLYFTDQGKPRHSIIYIAHLSESQRMFFVTLLVNFVVTWMRGQSGTTSLRSLLYFDEIFGYFPPISNPPSKKPLLTMLKQARAYGVGTILVTQNPVDIDYKGLSNAGTWFIGKLQTERDIMRVSDGLKGAIAEAGGDSDLDLKTVIAGLQSRVFLLHNVHQGAPVIFNTRWVMSYLRGPLTKPQIKELMADKKNEKDQHDEIPFEIVNTPKQAQSHSSVENLPPSLEPGIEQRFMIPKEGSGSLLYRPAIMALGRVRFADDKRGVDIINPYQMLCPPPDEFGRVAWEKAKPAPNWKTQFREDTVPVNSNGVAFADVPDTMSTLKSLNKVEDEYERYLYNQKRHEILEHPKLKIYQAAKESEANFRSRVGHLTRELRDADMDELQEKYEVKFEKITEKLRKEQQDLDEAKAELRGRRTDELINGAQTLISIFGGRSRSLSTASTKRRMARKANQKKEEAKEDIAVLKEKYQDLQVELDEKLEELRNQWEQIANGVVVRDVKPTKTNVKVDKILIAWLPKWVD